jgi:UDP-N-acetylglucosamine:LPS N-acetylglucosamine transferase
VLYQTTLGLLNDPNRLANMSLALQGMQVGDANEQIYQTLLALVKR